MSPALCFRIKVLMMEESSPPLRNVPTGRSAIICRRTASLKQGVQFVHQLRLVGGAVFARFDLPIARDGQFVILEGEVVPGGELGDSRKTSAGRNLETRGRQQGFIIGLPFDEWALEQAFDLGRESEPFADLPVVERLDPDVVACGKEFAGARVENGERELAVELTQAVGAPHLVSSQDDFGIAG